MRRKAAGGSDPGRQLARRIPGFLRLIDLSAVSDFQ
jgi:hypothetical protein